MNTRRIRLVAIGLVSGMLVSSLGLPAVSAQATKSGLKAKAKQAETAAMTKWESLTPEQQQHLTQTWKTDVGKAQAKWQSLTPEQQQQAMTAGKAEVQKGRQKWQQLPAGTSPTPTPTPAPATTTAPSTK
jgi:hypothetical protein